VLSWASHEPNLSRRLRDLEGIEIEQHGPSAVLEAIVAGNLESLEILLDAGVPLNAHLATTYGPELTTLQARSGVLQPYKPL